jgi:hypothetical protein
MCWSPRLPHCGRSFADDRARKSSERKTCRDRSAERSVTNQSEPRKSTSQASGSDTEEIWSGRRGSNPRPRPWQGRALPLSYTRIRDGGDRSPSAADLCQMRTGNATVRTQSDDTCLANFINIQARINSKPRLIGSTGVKGCDSEPGPGRYRPAGDSDPARTEGSDRCGPRPERQSTIAGYDRRKPVAPP